MKISIDGTNDRAAWFYRNAHKVLERSVKFTSGTVSRRNTCGVRCAFAVVVFPSQEQCPAPSNFGPAFIKLFPPETACAPPATHKSQRVTNSPTPTAVPVQQFYVSEGNRPPATQNAPATRAESLAAR
jgi:hypothetical protein